MGTSSSDCENPGKYEEEAVFPYRIYVLTGSLSAFMTFGLFILYNCNRHLRIHPNGIITHLLFSLSILSFVCAANGLIFSIKENIQDTGVYCHSFGVAELSCAIESHITWFFTISFILWNFAWLYDLVQAFKRPMHTTSKYMCAYRSVIYIIAACANLLAFLLPKDAGIYSMGPMYTCNLKLEICSAITIALEGLYMVAAFYVFCKYGRRSVIGRFKKSGSKLSFFFGIQKWYLITFLCTWCTNAFVLSGESYLRQMYAIGQSVRPILLIMPWVVQLFVTICSKRKVQLLTGSNVTTPRKSNVSETLREEIVEYLLQGICKSVTKFIKLGNTRTMYYDSPSFTDKLIRCICGCCYTSDLEPSQPVNTNSSILAQVEKQNIRLAEKAAINREAKQELVMVLPSKNGVEFVLEEEHEEEVEGIRFVSLGPSIFERLRKLHEINTNDIINLFTVDKLHKGELKIKLQSGKGGAFFVVPSKGNFLIKSITAEEYEVMTDILADYHQHFLTNPSSCITPIYGCYAMHLADTGYIKPLYFILMKNVLDVNLDSFPANTETYCFDVKGSSAGRRELAHPETILEANVDPNLQKLTLKDDDFFESYKHVEIPPIQGNKILEQLKKDAAFFGRYKLIDYSLLLFVINVPYQRVDIKTNFPEKEVQDNNDNTAGGIFRLSKEATEEEKTRDNLRNPCQGPFRLSEEGKSSNRTSSLLLEEKSGEKTSGFYRITGPLELNKLEVLNSLVVATPEKKKVVLEIQDDTNKEYPQQTVIHLVPTQPADKASVGFPEERKNRGSSTDELSKSATVTIADESSGGSSKGFSEGPCYNNVVEQLVFDRKKGGFFKRQFRFGIIDYLTLYTFRKRMERLVKGCVMKNPSVAAPNEYANRFMSCMRKMYE